MKKYFYSPLMVFMILGLCLCNTAKAQYVTIPDTNFVNWLNENGFGSCLTGNQLDTTCSAVTTTTTIDCGSAEIVNLTGIQYFSNLDTLSCSYNSLDSLPPLPPSLTYLDCEDNFSLAYLPSLPGSLQYLSCDNNSLAYLPNLPFTLQYLDCSYNSLTDLPVLPDTLQYLDCSWNQYLTGLPGVLPSQLLTLNCSYSHDYNVLPDLPLQLQSLTCYALDLSILPALPNTLTYLDCDGNLLTALPVLPPFLQQLNCYYNQIDSLPALPATLNLLDCHGDLLTSLPLLPASLQVLFASYNKLDSLPELPAGLISLDCSYNSLTTLPALPVRLPYINADSNRLTSIPELPDSMQAFDCGNNQYLTCLPQLKKIGTLNFLGTAVSCLPDYGTVTTSTPLLNTLPLCGIFNPSGCLPFWNISGQCFYDQNGNCIFDSSDVGTNYVKTKLFNGNTLVQQVFTGGEGFYSFDSVTYGNYTVQVDTSNLPFVVSCPGTNVDSTTLSAGNSFSYDNNFAFKCRAQGFDIGVQSVVNNNVPRPNAPFTLSTIAGDISQLYGARCASGISGQVTITFSGQVTYVGPALNALTPTTVNSNSISWTIADFGLISDFSSFNLLFQVSPQATAGSSLCFTVTVTPTLGDYNPSNNTLTYCFPVVNALDPNEKEVYPSGSIDTSSWLTYTIHFQNTGTAPAVNIRITDTLDNNLDPSTFQLLAYSAKNLTQIFGNAVVFNFPNINLPDSIGNDSSSRGYVQYKIKLKNNLTLGTQVQNTANIYFDLNAPVATNTTSDTVSTGQPCTVSYTTLNDTACAGAPFVYNGQTYYAPASFNDTLTNTSGCDSIVTVQLTAIGGDTTYLSNNICANEPYLFNGIYEDTTGTYTAQYSSVTGCDSTVILQLTVFPVAYTDTTVTFACGDSVSFGGIFYHVSGTFSDTLNASNGCDSIVTLQITVTGGDTTYLNDTICSNSNILFNGIYVDSSGIYIANYPSVGNCDSMVVLQLTVLPAYAFDTSISISCGDSVIFQGHVYKSAGTYTDTLKSVQGCDSIFTLQLIAPQDSIFNFGLICAGDSTDFFGTWVSASGSYAVVLPGNNTCDTLEILELIVRSPLVTYVYDTICGNDSLLFNGVYYDTTASVTAHFTSMAGCDSTVILALTAYPTYANTQSASISCGDSISFGGIYYHLSGAYSDTFTTLTGCDSILTLQLTVIGGDTTYTSDTICANNGLLFNGTYINQTGVYTAQYSSPTSCDSTVILRLTANPPPAVTLSWDEMFNEHWLVTGFADTGSCTNPGQFVGGQMPLSGGLPLGGIYSGTAVINDTLVEDSVFYAQFIQHGSYFYDTITYQYTAQNGCANTASDIVEFEICTGIASISANNLFDLYPNPAGDYTMIAVSPDAIGSTMKLFDVAGRQLMAMKLTSTPQRLPLSALPAGVYMVSVETGGESAVRLLVKTD